MFENIGGKIKMLAKILTALGCFASLVIGLAMGAKTGENGALLFLFIILIGCLVSWLSSFILYGFGQLVENSDILAKHYKNQSEKHNDISATDAAERHQWHCKEQSKNQSAISASDTVIKHKWRCDVCGNMTSEEICPTCNNQKAENLKEQTYEK